MTKNVYGMIISKSRIVIPRDATINESVFAYAIRYHLKQVYDWCLEIVSDTDTASSFG